MLTKKHTGREARPSRETGAVECSEKDHTRIVMQHTLVQIESPFVRRKCFLDGLSSKTNIVGFVACQGPVCRTRTLRGKKK